MINFHKWSDEIKGDRCSILEAVKLVDDELEFAISDFQKDKFIVLSAGQQNGEAFKHMSDSPEFRGDKDVFISCIQADSCWMADKLLMDDRDIAVAAARLDGLFALSFNHSDEDYYLSCISKHPKYLKEDWTKWHSIRSY